MADRTEADELVELVELMGETPRSLEVRCGWANGSVQKKTKGARRGSRLEALLVRAALAYFDGKPAALKRFIAGGLATAPEPRTPPELGTGPG